MKCCVHRYIYITTCEIVIQLVYGKHWIRLYVFVLFVYILQWSLNSKAFYTDLSKQSLAYWVTLIGSWIHGHILIRKALIHSPLGTLFPTHIQRCTHIVCQHAEILRCTLNSRFNKQLYTSGKRPQRWMGHQASRDVNTMLCIRTQQKRWTAERTRRSLFHHVSPGS